MSALSHGVTIKFFAFFKGLLRRPAANGEHSDEFAAAALTEPTLVPEADLAQTKAKGAGGPSDNGNGLHLPLQPVLGALPLELRGRVKKTDVSDITISIPLPTVLSQLATGAVKVSFGQVRRAAPQAFNSGPDRDQVLVSLPLSEVLAHLNPALLVRRPAQRRVEVPAEISSPFGSNGEGLIFSIGNEKAAAAPSPRAVTPPPAKTVEEAPSRLSLHSVPTPPAPTAIPISHMPPNLRQHPPAPVQHPLLPRGLAPTHIAPPPGMRPPAPAPAPHPALPRGLTPNPPPPAAPALPPAPAPTPPLHAPSVPSHTAPVLPLHTVPTPPAPAPTPGSEPLRLMVGLTSLAEIWPEALRQEIVQLNLVDAKVALPADLVENALKRGRVAFPWKVLRSWIKPAPLPSVSAHDAAELELPLKVLAPLFLARQKAAHKEQQKVAIDAEIPNLFFGFPKPEAAADKAVTGPVAKPLDTNYYVWDDTCEFAKVDETEFKRKASPGTSFVSRYATPNEIVSRASALEGVGGALIALPDGLMVANQLSSNLNAETLAAFLPQIFGKVSQCTKELRMGELNNLSFTVGNVPWKIFRVNSIFFAAFGKEGEPLPTGQLLELAAELDRKK